MGSKMLSEKSLSELRGIAQALDVPSLFQLDKLRLIQAIELKQKTDVSREEKDLIDRIYFKQRDFLRESGTDGLGVVQAKETLTEVLRPFVDRGLRFWIDGDRWYMERGMKTDEGHVSTPINVVVCCAKTLMI